MPRSRSRGAQPEGERAALSPAEVPFAAGTAGGTAGIMAAWRQSGGKGNLVPAEKCGGEECCGVSYRAVELDEDVGHDRALQPRLQSSLYPSISHQPAGHNMAYAIH
eukprot:gene13931-biopygen3135